LAESGKWQIKYFPSEAKARQVIKSIQDTREEHFKQAVTAEERHWINVVRTELGDLAGLRDVLDHYHRTGAGVRPISAQAAATEYVELRKTDRLNLATQHDISWRLRAFGEFFGQRPMHQITGGEIENWLRMYTEGWPRRSMWKRIKPLFDHAKRHRWLLENPVDDLVPPNRPGGRKEVYTPEQFTALLKTALENDRDVLLYLALAGLGFFRTQEIVRRIGCEDVLEWGDIIWEEGVGPSEIYVRESVAKTTRRKSGGERFVPIHVALSFALLEVPKPEREGRLIKWSVRYFSKRLKAVFEQAGVPFIDNGLRKSAISYWLAAYPEDGIVKVAQYTGNSEASCRTHYLKVLSREDGKRWFAIADEVFVKF
jgi:hypothetical protein